MQSGSLQTLLDSSSAGYDDAPGGLPRVQILDYEAPPERSQKVVEFRLIYKGPLAPEGSSGGGRAEQKHLLRKWFHKQLRELWQQHPELRRQSETKFIKSTTPPNMQSWPGPNFTQIIEARTADLQNNANAKTWPEHIADDHARCGGKFVPLVTKEGGFTCSLDILFLRRDNPGYLICQGGDIDNRIKVLFDGLKMPEHVSDLGDLPIEDDERPFYCLLEDDSLVTSVSITTDRLLLPMEPGDKLKHVYLVIHVTVLNPSALFAGNRLV